MLGRALPSDEAAVRIMGHAGRVPIKVQASCSTIVESRSGAPMPTALEIQDSRWWRELCRCAVVVGEMRAAQSRATDGQTNAFDVVRTTGSRYV